MVVPAMPTTPAKGVRAPEGGPARERILDAAEACLAERGIRQTTMAEVAQAAGVSRTWLYRHFSDKEALVAAALIRRDGAFWADAHQRVARARTLAGKVATAVALARTSPLGPLALELRDREPEAFARVMGTYTEDVVPGLAGFWEHHLVLARDAGLVRPDLDVPGAAEWVLRAVISLVTTPGEAVDVDDPRSVRRYLETYLVPALT